MADLITLKDMIVQEHDAARSAAIAAMKHGKSAVAHAIRAGELLAEAKAVAEYGHWVKLCNELPFSETAARGYMRLARLDPQERQRVADLSLRAALLHIAKPKPTSCLAGRPQRGAKADAIRAELAALAARRRVFDLCAKARPTLAKVAAQPTFNDDDRQALDVLRIAIEACEARFAQVERRG